MRIHLLQINRNKIGFLIYDISYRYVSFINILTLTSESVPDEPPEPGSVLTDQGAPRNDAIPAYTCDPTALHFLFYSLQLFQLSYITQLHQRGLLYCRLAVEAGL